MKLHALTIPNESTDWANWLEDLLVSDHLLDTVVELQLLSGNSQPGHVELDQLLGPSLKTVLDDGLGTLSEDEVRSLLAHPTSLLDLQEVLLLEGSDYWQRRLVMSTTTAEPPRPADNPTPNSDSRGWNIPGGSYLIGLVLATAACVAFVMMQPGVPAPKGWGFNNPDVFASAETEDEMLGILADAAGAWSNKVPENEEQLELRLKQFDKGCQNLLNQPLPQLAQQTREELFEICRQTRAKLAQHLAALEGGADLSTVLPQANETAAELAQSIRMLRTT